MLQTVEDVATVHSNSAVGLHIPMAVQVGKPSPAGDLLPLMQSYLLVHFLILHFCHAALDNVLALVDTPAGAAVEATYLYMMVAAAA